MIQETYNAFLEQLRIIFEETGTGVGTFRFPSVILDQFDRTVIMRDVFRMLPDIGVGYNLRVETFDEENSQLVITLQGE